MKQRQHESHPRPGRMQDGPFEEFRDAQPNRPDEHHRDEPRRRDEEKERREEERRHVPERIEQDDPVEQASDLSFPASDPPPFTP